MKKAIIVMFLCLFVLNGCRMNDNPNPGEKNNKPFNTIEVSPSASPSATAAPVSTSTPVATPEVILEPTPTAVNDPSKSTETPVPDVESDNGNGTSAGENGLYDLIICIDPGHGNPEIKGGQEKIAPDSEETKPAFAYGATGIGSGTPEYVLNMAVSLELRTLLEEQGFKVVLTRMSDDENLGNIDRALIGNEADSDLVIRIHADGSDKREVNGVSVLYPGNKYLHDAALLEKSKLAAQFVHDAIIESTGAKPRGIVKRDDLTGFNWSTRPVILVEMGFMSNPDEDKRLNETTYRQKIAAGIFEGILDYFNKTNN